MNQMTLTELRSRGRLKQRNGSSSAFSGALRNARAGFERGASYMGKVIRLLLQGKSIQKLGKTWTKQVCGMRKQGFLKGDFINRAWQITK